MRNELYHYGVLGMKWGVRRYQPYGSGGYIPKGKVINNKNPKLTNAIYDSLSLDDKRKVTARDNPPKEYTNEKEYGEYLAKSFVYMHGDLPVSAFDVWREGDNDAALALMTRGEEKYRGKGYASKVVSEGMKYVDEHKFDTVYWDVRADNKGSIRLAEKSGFEQVPFEEIHNGDPNWLLYQKKYKR